ncbi:MAG: hypothetical protein AAB932_03465, partial [Patescibacteria group bacterium]
MFERIAAFLDVLKMKEDGLPVDMDVVIDDVLRRPAIIFDYFGGLINDLEQKDYSENTDLFVFPYDWRLPIEQNSELLKQKINDVLAQTNAVKVDLVAHSMGGLVAKRYFFDHPNDQKIDTIIFLGTPHLGAPKAAKALLFGEDFDIPFLSQSKMKEISRNMTSVYHLLPGRQYLTQIGQYVTDRGQGLDYAATRMFLQNTGTLNDPLLTRSDAFHTSAFDTFTPQGSTIYSISGCKAPTIGEIIRRDKRGGGTEYQIKMVAGDKTVPLGSADVLDTPSANRFYFTKADHAKMPSQDILRQWVVALVDGSSNTSTLPKNIVQDKSKCTLKGKTISVHSPVDIHAYDANGNHLGLDPNGDIEEFIEGASYDDIDHNKFLFLPEDEGQQYTIQLQGTDA